MLNFFSLYPRICFNQVRYKWSLLYAYLGEISMTLCLFVFLFIVKPSLTVSAGGSECMFGSQR